MWRDSEGRVFRQVSQHDLVEVAQLLLNHARHVHVWLFRGDMGSGKTTFIKVLASERGVTEAMSSPTFSIVNEYNGRGQSRIFHFDFYRIKNEAEAYDIGTEDYFYSGNYCFIEWPDRIPSLIPAQRIEVSITPETQTLRTIAISVHDGKEENRI